ncbi:efflux RND transporter permease subunit [Lutibaculum baratangense]|uniref:RND multidrug efflux transporter n=1 Tax=Lutibaculum baratangense AMV1 TaxID=631454 RepID=V4RUS5_9HYPH|nr:efflux RND transporter permease subunit [Lutibaculum baratangense]ESR26825.1 RND multidrug efflux transporter [Lutibaculum baratangense AMV1]
MNGIIDWSFGHTRTVLMALVLLLLAGTLSYIAIPKESSPEIEIPTFYVSVTYEGISPEDAERLLVRPLETELQSIAGLDQMTGVAAEGYANMQLEFQAGFDADAALDDVREAVDRAQADLPAGADEPIVREINTALFPILTVILSGPVPERALVGIARELQDGMEALPGVLEVDIGGDREEVLEVLLDPAALESYDISFEELLNQVQRNNRLVAAGAIDTGAGRLTLKVPGVIENMDDVMAIPVKVDGGAVVTLRDIALVRSTFRDPTGFARIGGQPALSLEVKKRVGANIIETVGAVKELVGAQREEWPESVDVTYLQDQSEQVETTLTDLQNNVLSAIFLVMVVIVATLGVRSAILVGLAIPGSFLAGIAVLHFMGFTMNIVVLFSLILVVGMLVDGAIVTTELADRRLAENVDPKRAYAEAAKRMAWPIIASTATTLAVFLPLLFWTGVVGEFMKFLPITVLVTLTASLFMALVFVPVLGGAIGRRSPSAEDQLASIRAAESGDLDELQGWTRGYVRLLGRLVRRPLVTLLGALVLLVGSYVGYGFLGRGVEFFPAVEPEMAQVVVTSRDSLSVWEKDALVGRVEDRIMGVEGLESVYARTIGQTGVSERSEDTIGVIQLDLADWDARRPAAQILEEVRRRTADVAGVDIRVQEQEGGPAQGKPIQVRVAARNSADLVPAADELRRLMQGIGGFVDIEDSRPLPGVEWRLEVDREQAARYGADVTTLGQAVQMLTAGLQLAQYRPETADEEVDIRVRFPAEQRNLERLEQLQLSTASGLVPISNFVELVPAPKTGVITRVDARRVITVEADVAEGELASQKTEALRAAVADAGLPEGVQVTFAGQSEDQAEASTFLVTAFMTAILLMLMALVTQFNSIFQALLVLSAIVFSTAGVLIGLLVTGRPFGVVMGGIGIIALAGIVVNNNIVLIDTFNEMRAKGCDAVEAALRSGAQRLRPVLLTSVTTVLGLMPMVFGMNIDLIGRNVEFGAPSTQYWIDLSTAIAGGLTFATLLTLLLTPCMLVLGSTTRERISRWRRRGAGSPAAAGRAS